MTPGPPSSRGGEGREGKGKDREGRGGTGRDRARREGGEEWGVVGRGGALDMGSAPLKTSSGSAPGLHLLICAFTIRCRHRGQEAIEACTHTNSYSVTLAEYVLFGGQYRTRQQKKRFIIFVPLRPTTTNLASQCHDWRGKILA